MFTGNTYKSYNIPGMNSGKEVLVNAVKAENAILKLTCHKRYYPPPSPSPTPCPQLIYMHNGNKEIFCCSSRMKIPT